MSFNSDGFTLSGLFVAISCIHERLKVEGEVDVFQTVRNIKSSQAAIITSPVGCRKYLPFLFCFFYIKYFHTFIDL